MGRGSARRQALIPLVDAAALRTDDVLADDPELAGRFVLVPTARLGELDDAALAAEADRLHALREELLREERRADERTAVLVAGGMAAYQAWRIASAPAGARYQVDHLVRCIRLEQTAREQRRLLREDAAVWRTLRKDPSPMRLSDVLADPNLPDALPLTRIPLFGPSGRRLHLSAPSEYRWPSGYHAYETLGALRGRGSPEGLRLAACFAHTSSYYPGDVLAAVVPRAELGRLVLEVLTTPAGAAPVEEPFGSTTLAPATNDEVPF